MDKIWKEQDTGIFFPFLTTMNECMLERLEMLVMSGCALRTDEGVLIPSESVVVMSDEDCELFDIPERNPYQLCVQANGDLAHNNLHYFIEVLQPNGCPFINPSFNGAFIHINQEKTYRLSMDQYQLLCIAGESNKNISSVKRSNISAYNLTNLSKIQNYAEKSAAKFDNILSKENSKIVIPDKLDIQFKHMENGEIHVEPVLLMEDDFGDIQPITAVDDFQKEFSSYRGSVKNVYSGEDRTKYVCNPDIREGLERIKKVEKEIKTKKLTPQDMERFEQQPRELFPDEIFRFMKDDEKKNYDEQEEAWLPSEGDFIGSFYSERVKGTTAIHRSTYYGNDHPIDWLPLGGESDPQPSPGNGIQGTTEGGVDINTPLPHPEVTHTNENGNHQNISEGGTGNAVENPRTKMGEDEEPKKVKEALDIKENFDGIDYKPNLTERDGTLDRTVLRDGITLMDYQRDGISWMFREWQRGYNGVLLADDMGLGKTLQTLVFISALRKGCLPHSTITKPILIVTPIALQENWIAEYNKFINDGIFNDILSLHGGSLRKFETGSITPNGKKKLELRIPANSISLTTYETLRDYQFSFAEVDWGIIIADEAQKLKNPSTGITKAVKAMKHDYTICLSGTPVENSWADLWSIMDFVQPAMLGDLENFRKSYILKLKGLEGDVAKIEKLGRDLKEHLKPLFLRRMKKDKLEGIPRKTVHRRSGQMPDYQKRCYMSVIEAARNHEMHPFMMIAKLRDISLHPDIGSKQVSAFFAMPANDVINQSARLVQCFEILTEIKERDEKALIFLVSKKMQLILKHLIYEKYGIKVLNPVNGDMNGTARQNIIDKFNSATGFNVLILSPEAAGVGFTITSANNVIHLSRTWNPAIEDQATDRVYRIGQKKDVKVYIPMSSHIELGDGGSFDEKLDKLLSYKRRLSENVLFPTGDSKNDGIQMFKELTQTSSSSMNIYEWSLDDIDQVVGDVFEQIVCDLYNTMDGWSAEKTPRSNDYGVDVVALSDNKKKGFLIQCKHKENPEQPEGINGVQEVSAAVPYYRNKHGAVNFEPVLLTNSKLFTNQARRLASENGVKLISRSELAQMLEANPVMKRI